MNGIRELGPVTRAILDKMADIYIDEYEAIFKVAYERTVQALQHKRPVEPDHEVRNAFDHFALATRCAFVVDRLDVPPTVEEITRVFHEPSPDRPQKPEDGAYNNLAQARRHLIAGLYYCLEHQVMATAVQLRAHILLMAEDARRAEASATARALVVKYWAMPRIFAGPEVDPEKLRQDIERFQSRCEVLTELLRDMLQLLKDIRATL